MLGADASVLVQPVGGLEAADAESGDGDEDLGLVAAGHAGQPSSSGPTRRTPGSAPIASPHWRLSASVCSSNSRPWTALARRAASIEATNSAEVLVVSNSSSASCRRSISIRSPCTRMIEVYIRP